MSDFSSYLFPATGALDGAARLIDLGGTMVRHNSSRSGADADIRGLRADLAAVGQDVREVAASMDPRER